MKHSSAKRISTKQETARLRETHYREPKRDQRAKKQETPRDLDIPRPSYIFRLRSTVALQALIGVKSIDVQ